MQNTISLRVKDFLKEYPPFQYIPKEVLLSIAEKVEIGYLEKDEIVFNQNDRPHKHFYIIYEGTIRLYRFEGSEKTIVDVCEQGDVFGLRPLIMNEDYLMGATAHEECILYGIPIVQFKEIAFNYPQVSKYLIASFATNTRNPFTDKHRGKLFANTNEIQKGHRDFYEAQSAQFNKNPITCSKDISIREAAKTMRDKVINSIVVVEDKRPIGIITDKDFRTKIATGEHSINAPVAEIMSSPVKTFKANMSVAEAQIALLKHKVSHLCITEDGTDKSELVGILGEYDLVMAQANSPLLLIKQIKNAKDAETLQFIRNKASELTKAYLDQEIPIYFVTKVIAEINIAITKKAIGLSLEKMGKSPPVAFTWLALGSQGRKEQLLMTDQDNALVYEHVPEEKFEATRDYFLELAKNVTEILHQVGYDYCTADMMASNPKWCLSLEQWKTRFNDWITDPVSEKLILGIIFFDFDYVYGDSGLYDAMSGFVLEKVGENHHFLARLAKATIDNPPPLGFFKQFVLEEDGENKDSFDIKSRAIRPLVDAARIFTLYNNLKINNTIARFEKLMEIEPQNSDLFESCANAFKILLKFRTLQGLNHGDSGRFVDIKNLSKPDRLQLKSCFKPIKNIQETLKVRFNTVQML